jgi:predicted regulator of Ras-like GTPase activity (Roadblock/LC7/MglB family)/flagellar biosynthesis chaperone FliJ
MVLKNIRRIQETLPNVLHVIMFYNDGTVFQTTFDPPVNIPKLGVNLSEIIAHFKTLKEFCNMEFGLLKNAIFETKNVIIGIIRIGEESFMAIFMENRGEKGIDFEPIKKYIGRLEYLVDMDRIEIEKEGLLAHQRDLEEAKKKLENLGALKNSTEKKLDEVKDQALHDEINAELNMLRGEIDSLEKFIQEKTAVVEKIEKEVKNSEMKWLEDKYL